MKKLSLALLLSLTTSLFASTAFADVGFHAKVENIDCKISAGKVVRIGTIGDSGANFSQTSTIQLTGFETLASKAVANAKPSDDTLGYVYEIILNGKTTRIYGDNGMEADTLIHFIATTCNL